LGRGKMLKRLIRGWWTIGGMRVRGYERRGVERRATSQDILHPADSRNRVLTN